MSLAFPALFIFLVIVPGIILHYTYSKGFWRTSPSSIYPLSDEIAYSLIGACFLHLIWAHLLSIFGIRIDLDSALMLLLGSFGPDNRHFDTAIQSVTRQPLNKAYYFTGLYVFSALLGYGAHALVRGRKWDRKTRLFRFNNDWYYLMSGEMLDFKGMLGRPKEIDGVYLSAVIHQGGDSYLYRGIVSEYYLDKAGSLDRVLLRLAHRRLLTKDRVPGQPRDPSKDYSDDSRYYDIVGDFLILRYAEMQTINIEYIVLTEASPHEPATVPKPA